MSDHEHGFDGPLSPELAALDAALGRLLLEDAGCAPTGLEDRVFAASRRAISPLPRDIAPVGASVDRLANAERAAGSEALEDTAFELSREAVASGRYVEPRPALGLVGEGELSRVTVRRRFPMRALAIAAAIGLAGGAVTVWQAGRAVPAKGQNMAAHGTGSQSADQLAANISDEMDVLFEVIGTDHAVSSADTADSDQEHDATWIDNLFSKESL